MLKISLWIFSISCRRNFREIWTSQLDQSEREKERNSKVNFKSTMKQFNFYTHNNSDDEEEEEEEGEWKVSPKRERNSINSTSSQEKRERECSLFHIFRLYRWIRLIEFYFISPRSSTPHTHIHTLKKRRRGERERERSEKRKIMWLRVCEGMLTEITREAMVRCRKSGWRNRTVSLDGVKWDWFSIKFSSCVLPYNTDQLFVRWLSGIISILRLFNSILFALRDSITWRSWALKSIYPRLHSVIAIN